MSNIELANGNHELVALHRDAASGLTAIIAVHDRTLGPAIGGCRILPYRDLDAALDDVLRLSRGMTFKCAIAGIPYGGGKAVIIADPQTDKTPELLHAFGAFVESLGGRYITSFDSGTTLDDVRTIGERTQYAAGYADGYGNASESTAVGVFRCMQASWQSIAGADLAGVRVGIQGLGNVGSRLARLLIDAGAVLTVTDKDSSTAAELPSTWTTPEQIHAADIDIFAPCALGAVLNERTIPDIRARIVCGGANNQLATPDDAERLRARGIVYCPDYLVNAGGIVELHHQHIRSNATALCEHLSSLADRLTEVLVQAQTENVDTVTIADRIVAERLGKTV